jgi:hypothetical protein
MKRLGRRLDAVKRRIATLTTVSVILFFILTLPFAARVHAAIDWTVTMTSRIETYTSTVVLGVANDATNGYDTSYDKAAPPPAPIGIQSYFYYPNNPPFRQMLSKSIIPPSPNMNWTFIVQTTGVTGTVVLNWTTIPPQYNAYLLDSTGERILVDMTQVSEYSYPAEGSSTMVQFTAKFVIPDFSIGPLLALVVCFASYGVFRISRRP